MLASDLSGTYFGQGVRAGIVFTNSGTVPGPVMEEQPGSPASGARPGASHESRRTPPGLASIRSRWKHHHVARVVLSRVHLRRGRWATSRPHTNTAGMGIGFIQKQSGFTASLSTAVTYNEGNTSNRYVAISGASFAANNGVFPIIALASASTIVYFNPAAVAETDFFGTYVNLAAVGPTPWAADPGFLADDVRMDFVHTQGGGSDVPTFTATTGTGTVGDGFALAATELNRLNAIPRDGSEFTLTCAAADCPLESASGTILGDRDHRRVDRGPVSVCDAASDGAAAAESGAPCSVLRP